MKYKCDKCKKEFELHAGFLGNDSESCDLSKLTCLCGKCMKPETRGRKEKEDRSEICIGKNISLPKKTWDQIENSGLSRSLFVRQAVNQKLNEVK